MSCTLIAFLGHAGHCRPLGSLPLVRVEGWFASLLNARARQMTPRWDQPRTEHRRFRRVGVRTWKVVCTQESSELDAPRASIRRRRDAGNHRGSRSWLDTQPGSVAAGVGCRDAMSGWRVLEIAMAGLPRHPIGVSRRLRSARCNHSFESVDSARRSGRLRTGRGRARMPAPNDAEVAFGGRARSSWTCLLNARPDLGLADPPTRPAASGSPRSAPELGLGRSRTIRPTSSSGATST